MFKRGILFLFMAILAQAVSAQWIEDPKIDGLIRQGIQDTYNIRFESAEKAFQAVIQSRPNHPAGYFFYAMVDWWRIMIDMDNESRDQKFFSKLQKVVSICDQMLDRNRYDVTALFFKGGAIGFKGRLQANRKSWLAAASAGKDALPIVREVTRLAPQNADINLGMGIYNYYAAVLPESYPLLKPFMLFLPKGDRTKGLKQLKFTADKGRYSNFEAMHFLMLAYYNTENKPAQALIYAQKLHALFPENPVFHRYYAKALVRISNWAEVSKTCQEILRNAGAKKTGYDRSMEREAYYYLGYDAFVRKDYASAMKQFAKSDELSRGIDVNGPSAFMVLANLRMGYIHDLLGQRSLAIKQYDKVLGMTEYNNSHSQARMYKGHSYTQ
jgi:tetratricopeptide (TPR) repeat protein